MAASESLEDVLPRLSNEDSRRIIQFLSSQLLQIHKEAVASGSAVHMEREEVLRDEIYCSAYDIDWITKELNNKKQGFVDNANFYLHRLKQSKFMLNENVRYVLESVVLFHVFHLYSELY